MQTLKPCPFCGGKASIERKGNRSMSTIYSCDWCGCSLETGEEWDHGKAWNTRPAPAATDTGLVTMGGINLAIGEMISRKDFDGGNPLHIPYCRKDRAEELLAAERAEKEKLERQLSGARTVVAAAQVILSENKKREADNAVQAARIKEYETGLVDFHREMSALEAKLAAAEKALDEISDAKTELNSSHDYSRGWNDALFRVRQIARAVLGGKP